MEWPTAHRACLVRGRLLMVRKMAQESYRQRQWTERYAANVAPINGLVDALGEVEGRVRPPYVAPCHGGIDAPILSVLRDPGPKADAADGSGFLCTENDDPTAQAQAELMLEVGLSTADLTPWNAYPWYINRKPTAAELACGIGPLVRVMELMPRLRVVLLQGGEARAGWRKLERQRADVVEALHERGVTVEATHHPGRQALWHPDPAVRSARLATRRASYERVAGLLRGKPGTVDDAVHERR
jgi:hypothetical protein